MGDDPGRLYRLDGVAHIAGVINDEPRRCISSVRRQQGMRLDESVLPPENQVQKFAGSAALAWLYRCMCRVTNRHVVKLAGPLQLLQSWIFWRFPSFRPTGYDAFSWPLASRWSGYNPRISNKGPQVQMARLKIDLLQPRDFIWMPYSALDVIQVVHPEVLEPRHTMLWRCVTSLIYFAVVEWHQDGRGGDHWFPAHLPDWHLHWQERAEHILQFDIVADPGPSHDFLTWWHQHGKRFLSPEMLLGDPRGGHDGEWYGSGMGDPTSHTDAGLGGGPLGDYFVGVPGDDQTLQESTSWVSPGSMFPDFLASDGIVAEFGGPHFLEDIQTIM
ncbi:hypothetical protein Ahy_B03g062415 [Arachis hypogaea]|uniref:Aminotransferase-like plant mobile domain-containing protein n=1 Tax=Arachis hypogaea TaxID=3818 RepID=A0A444ZU41_ARAHY|nr:hypothetical protein Ahy_B03g062415 [Arachis hypogaea]